MAQISEMFVCLFVFSEEKLKSVAFILTLRYGSTNTFHLILLMNWTKKEYFLGLFFSRIGMPRCDEMNVQPW